MSPVRPVTYLSGRTKGFRTYPDLGSGLLAKPLNECYAARFDAQGDFLKRAQTFQNILKEFWAAKNRVRDFPRCFYSVVEQLGYESKPKDLIKQFAKQQVIIPDQSYELVAIMTRSTTGERIRKRVNNGKLYIDLLTGICALGAKASRLKGHADLAVLQGMLEQWHEVLSASGVAPPVSSVTPHVTPRDAKSFAQFLKKFIHLDPLQAATAHLRFARQSEWDSLLDGRAQGKGDGRKHYLVYRLDSRSGYVMKSFLVIKHQPGVPLCFFSNYVHDVRHSAPSGARETNGVVLPMNKALYLIGAIDGGQGLKMMVLPRESPAKEEEGLLISFDHGRQMVAAKFWMKETSIMTSQDAGVGLFKLAALKEELGNGMSAITSGGAVRAALSLGISSPE